MTDVFHFPHPFVTSNVLYVHDAPPRVKWEHLVLTFKPCGSVKSLGATKTTGKSRTWTIGFSDIAHAEMALATLQGTFVKGLPQGSTWPLALSYSAYISMDDPLSNCWNLPQYVKGVRSQALQSVDLFTLFSLFRIAGPLAFIHFDVDLGNGVPGCTVKYWGTEHAEAAELVIPEALNGKLRTKAQLSLVTYDPCSLIVEGIGTSSAQSWIKGYFLKFGVIVKHELVNTGQKDAHLVIMYAREEAAEQAKNAMSGKIINVFPLNIRYLEYTHEHGHPRPQGEAKDRSGPQTHQETQRPPRQDQFTGDPPPDPREPKKTNQHNAESAAEAIRLLREAEEAESAALEQAEALERIYFDAVQRRIEVNRVCRRASDELDLALMAVQRVERLLEEVMARKDAVDKEHRNAAAAALEVEEILRAALREEGREKSRRDAAQVRAEEAKNRASAARAHAEARVDPKSPWEKATDDANDTHEADIHAEERQREERLNAEMKAREEQERARKMQEEKEKAERKAEETRKKEQAAKEDEQRKKIAYAQAVRQERKRCETRDEDIRLSHDPDDDYPEYYAYQRFEYVRNEFATIKFDEKQPLTFWSVPWPILEPRKATPEDITWEMVENFFVNVRFIAPNEYRSILETTHRSFHPDKWRARRILQSVQDPETRASLEAAGNIVAQALTPLWLKSRKDQESSDDEFGW